MGRFNTEFENSDQISLQAYNHYERLEAPFDLPSRTAPKVTLPVGAYRFSDFAVLYTLGQQRRASGTISTQYGQFYDGAIAALSYTTARVSVTKPLSLDPTIAINHIELPRGTFTTSLLRARTDYAFSPRMFASTLIQY